MNTNGLVTYSLLAGVWIDPKNIIQNVYIGIDNEMEPGWGQRTSFRYQIPQIELFSRRMRLGLGLGITTRFSG